MSLVPLNQCTAGADDRKLLYQGSRGLPQSYQYVSCLIGDDALDLFTFILGPIQNDPSVSLLPLLVISVKIADYTPCGLSSQAAVRRPHSQGSERPKNRGTQRRGSI